MVQKISKLILSMFPLIGKFIITYTLIFIMFIVYNGFVYIYIQYNYDTLQRHITGANVDLKSHIVYETKEWDDPGLNVYKTSGYYMPISRLGLYKALGFLSTPFEFKRDWTEIIFRDWGNGIDDVNRTQAMNIAMDLRMIAFNKGIGTIITPYGIVEALLAFTNDAFGKAVFWVFNIEGERDREKEYIYKYGRKPVDKSPLDQNLLDRIERSRHIKSPPQEKKKYVEFYDWK